MSAVLLAWIVSSALASAGALVAIVAQRRAWQAELRVRLVEHDARELRAAVRALIGASRVSRDALRAALAAAVRNLLPEADVVLVFERDGIDLLCVHAAGLRGEPFFDRRLPLETDRSPITEAFSRAHRIGPDSRGAIIPGDRVFAAFPLVENGASIAVVYAGSQSKSRLVAVEALGALVDLAVPAYLVAIERENDRARASYDALTGLLTPRSFRIALAEAVARAEAGGDRRVSVLFIDSDHFKLCNDTLGHAAGDLILRALARLLTANCGVDGVAARNGGDEFCIFFERTSKSRAVAIAEALRAAIATYPFDELFDGRAMPSAITASIGVASLASDASTSSALLERADAAMYFSKREGRNRVSFYTTEGTLAVFDSSAARESA